MARTAEDCALILNAIAGFDERDPTSADVPVADYAAQLEPVIGGSRPLEHVRIGVPRNFYFDRDVVLGEVADSVRATVPVLESLGAEVREIDFPDPDYHQDNQAFTAETGAYHEERFLNRPEELSELPRQRVASGMAVTGMDYARARWRQQEFKHAYGLLMREIDLVLTPTSPVLALDISEVEPAGPGRILARHTAPFNTLGVPTISLPCGFSASGLPIGLQLSGRWWEEGLVLRAAHAYQHATDWHRRRPPL
jgi:aspartyl-tRNA(Asn)/glutamyl-tRNA(Gln) amidotransferase subunit A